MAGIIFENVSKVYGKVKAVESVNLIINDKEFMVLVGPSGCGKSTLLRMIAGLEEISGGKLFIDHEVVNDLPPKDRDIAIVFQNYALYPHMTTYENLSFGLRIRGVNKKLIHEKVLETARILEIEPLLDRKPKAMSGGQRQRIAIGRAIIRDPKVFLFDEPLSNLDAKLRAQMRLEIAKLHQKLRTTMVYVTHDQVEAMTLGDRIAVMNQGKIQQIDTPHNLYTHPDNLFVAGFIGTPPMNFIYGRITGTGAGLCFEETHHTLKINLANRPELAHYDGKAVVMGIRPEHIHAEAENLDRKYTILKVEIQFLERFGHEIFAFFTLHDKQLVTRLPADTTVEVGAEAALYFDQEKLYFFDLESGAAIR